MAWWPELLGKSRGGVLWPAPPGVGCHEAVLPGVSLGQDELAGCEAMSLRLSWEARDSGLLSLDTSALMADSKGWPECPGMQPGTSGEWWWLLWRAAGRNKEEARVSGC